MTNPTLISTFPLNNSSHNSLTLKLYLTFSEIVNVNTGNLTIHDSSNDNIIETIDITSGLVTGTGTQVITINPSTTLTVNKTYYINIASTALRDNDSNSYAGISDSTTFKFTTITNSTSESGSKILKKIIESSSNPNHNDAYETYIMNTSGDIFSMGIDDSTNKFVISNSPNLNNNPLMLIETDGTITVTETLKASAMTTTSDRNLKKNIKKLENVSEKINSLRGVSFNWINEHKDENLKDNIGLIAQEVEEEFPELVFTDLESGLKSVNYSQFVSVLIEGFKEMTNEVRILENKIKELEVN